MPLVPGGGRRVFVGVTLWAGKEGSLLVEDWGSVRLGQVTEELSG